MENNNTLAPYSLAPQYYEALAEAKDCAKAFKKTCVVLWWSGRREFSASTVSSMVRVGLDGYAIAVTSCEEDGSHASGSWVKDFLSQDNQAKEVAA